MGVKVRTAVLLRSETEERGFLLDGLGLQFKAASSLGIAVAHVDSSGPAAECGNIHVGDLVLEANNKMLLYATHHEMLLAIAESPDRVTLRIAAEADMMRAGFVDCDTDGATEQTPIIQEEEKQLEKITIPACKTASRSSRQMAETGYVSAAHVGEHRDEGSSWHHQHQSTTRRPQVKQACADVTPPSSREFKQVVPHTQEPGARTKNTQHPPNVLAPTTPAVAKPTAKVDVGNPDSAHSADSTDRLDKLLSSPHLRKALSAKESELDSVHPELEETKEKNKRDAARKAKKHLERKARKKSIRAELETIAGAKEDAKRITATPTSRAEALQLAMGNTFAQEEDRASPHEPLANHVDVMLVEFPAALEDTVLLSPGAAVGMVPATDLLQSTNSTQSQLQPQPECGKADALPIAKKKAEDTESLAVTRVQMSGSTVWKEVMGLYTEVPKTKHFGRPVFQNGKWFLYYQSKAWRCSSAVGKDKCNLSAVGTSKNPCQTTLRWMETPKAGGVVKPNSRIKVTAAGSFEERPTKPEKGEASDLDASDAGRKLAKKRVKGQAAKQAQKSTALAAAMQAKEAAKARSVENAAKVRENTASRRANPNALSTSKRAFEPIQIAHNEATALASSIKSEPVAVETDDAQNITVKKEHLGEPQKLNTEASPAALPIKAVPTVDDLSNPTDPSNPLSDEEPGSKEDIQKEQPPQKVLPVHATKRSGNVEPLTAAKASGDVEASGLEAVVKGVKGVVEPANDEGIAGSAPKHATEVEKLTDADATMVTPLRPQFQAEGMATPSPSSKPRKSPPHPPEIVRTPGNSFQSDEWRQVNATLFAKLEAEKDEAEEENEPENPFTDVAVVTLSKKVLGSKWRAAELPGLQYTEVGDAAADGCPKFLPTRTVKLVRQPSEGFGFEVLAPSSHEMGIKIAAIKLGGAVEHAGMRVGEVIVCINSDNVLDCRTTASIVKKVQVVANIEETPVSSHDHDNVASDPHSMLLDRLHTHRDKLARSLYASKGSSDRHAKKQEVARIDAGLEWLAEREKICDVHVQRCCSPDGKSLGFQVTNAGSMFGARVTVVHDGGAAELAGILPGDILLRVDGNDVLWSFTSEIIKRIKACDSVATISVCRRSTKPRTKPPTEAFSSLVACPPVPSNILETNDSLVAEEDFETAAKDALELAASQAGDSLKKAWSSFVTFCEESTSALLDDDSSSMPSSPPPASSSASPRRPTLTAGEGGSPHAPARSRSLDSVKRSNSYGSISSAEAASPAARSKLVRKYLVRRQPSDFGRWGLSLQIEQGHKGPLLRLDAITSDGAVWRAGAHAEEGSVLVAVNGVLAIGLSLNEVTERIGKSSEKIILAVCSYEELFNVSQKDLVESCSAFDFSQDAGILAAEAELKLVDAWDRFTEWIQNVEDDKDREWETPVKKVTPIPVVVPTSKSQVAGTLKGDKTCAMCGHGVKSVIFGCGHAACSTCSAKCHACPVKGCRRIILTRTKMEHRFRSVIHEEMCRGTDSMDMDSGSTPRQHIRSATFSAKTTAIVNDRRADNVPAAKILVQGELCSPPTPDAKLTAFASTPIQKATKKSRRRLVAVEEWIPQIP
eukprot:gene1253-28478_t